MFSPKVAKDLSVWPLFGVTFVVITMGAAKGTKCPCHRLPLAASSTSVTNSITIPMIASGGNIKNSKPI